MATLPAEIPASSNQVAAPQVNPLANGFGGLSVFRQIGLMVGLAASIAIGFAVVLWSMEPDYQPLLSNLSNVDATEAVDVLKASDIPYKIDDRSGALLVASENVYDARLKLAALGITDNKSVGFELLDKEQSLGTSQFMENISFRRGLEGELSRTIASLNSVKSARVHLALPKTSVFVRDARKPTASVFVELSRGRRLQEEQVNAIINLVASSVPQLESSDVTIIDQNGRLLSEVGKSETAVESARQFSYTLKLEDVLNKRVQQILEPVIGGDKFKVQVSAEVDFTAVEQTQEAYNPEISVLRSEQTSEDERSGAIGAGGVPGALSNQPPGTATAPEVATAGAAGTVAPVIPPRNVRTQATRNFELDRSISHTKHQQGKVQRISVAVVVDNKAGAAGGNNTEVGTPWEPAELENFTNLVKSAVGFSEARGDTVTVINAAFAPIPVIEAEAEPETPIWETPFFLKMVKQVMALVLVLILVFAVLRPIMKSLSDTGAQKNALAQATANAQAAANAAASGGGEQGMGMPGMGGQRANAGGAGSALLLGSGQNYDMQLNSAQALVADNPERAAQVIRQWVTKDE
jgi:flagellar M-ring protein FliF